MFEVKYHRDFNSQARTLSPSYIGNNASGWIITGVIHEDYYRWVNEFHAYHPAKNWRVDGDFEDLIKATSPDALDDFLKHHPFDEWEKHNHGWGRKRYSGRGTKVLDRRYEWWGIKEFPIQP